MTRRAGALALRAERPGFVGDHGASTAAARASASDRRRTSRDPFGHTRERQRGDPVTLALVTTKTALALASALVLAAFACGGADEASPAGGASSGMPASGDAGAAADAGGGGGDADASSEDASSEDAAADAQADGATPPDAGPDAAAPAVAYVGRFDFSDPQSPRTSWPGARIVARFTGTGVSATFSSASGGDGNATWLNVLVDGAPQAKRLVSGTNVALVLASGLAAGPHTIEVEKRTEASWGALTFHGFTFDGPGQLLPPPARPTRRIEFLAESTIDGFGVEGDVNTTCMGDAPPEFNDARKSTAHYTATALSAEHHLVAQSGKGLVKNEDGADTTYFPAIYGRTLAEDAAKAWDFTAWTPDVVVISLGGTDYAGGASPPGGFATAYDGLVTQIRARHPNAHIFMTVWSQIKDATRTSLGGVLDGIAAAHPTDTKLHVFQFTEATYPTDETGCYEHANDAHHQEAAAELVAAIKTATGW